MTDMADMVELARRRAGVKKEKKAAEKARKAIDTSIVYITLKEVAERLGERIEAVRWAMRGQKAIKVPVVCSKGATGVSYAEGYTAEQVEAVFKAVSGLGFSTEQAASNLVKASKLLSS